MYRKNLNWWAESQSAWSKLCVCVCMCMISTKGLTYQPLTVAGLQGGLRGHRPTLLLYFCQLHANFTCIFALMQEFLYQFCVAYLYWKRSALLNWGLRPSLYINLKSPLLIKDKLCTTVQVYISGRCRTAKAIQAILSSGIRPITQRKYILLWCSTDLDVV